MKRPLASSALAAMLCLAGCGGHGAAPRAGTAVHAARARALNISNRPTQTRSLRSLREAEIFAPQASWLSYYDGSIWVKRDDGYVIKVDPGTNKRIGMVGSFTGQEDYCQGIGAGGGAVWSCQQGFITRIDPKTVRIVARIPIIKAFDQGRYVFARGRLWVITGKNGNQLTGIDSDTNRPGPPIALPYTCSDLAPGGDAVWVLCPYTGHVVKVDVSRARVVRTIAIPSTYSGYATRSDLWVGSNSDLVRIDATTLRPKAVFHNAGPGMEGDVNVEGKHVWVSTNYGPLYMIDSATNTVVEHVTAPPGLGGGALIAAAGSLWNTPGSDGPLVRIRVAH